MLARSAAKDVVCSAPSKLVRSRPKQKPSPQLCRCDGDVAASTDRSKADVDLFAETVDVTTDQSLIERWASYDDGDSKRVRTNENGLFVNANFDSGNIDVVNIEDPSNIELRIRHDPFCETDGRAHYQWFHFRVTGTLNTPLTLNITNAGGASYPAGWEGYNACCSYDRVNWFRVPSSYNAEQGVFTISHTPEHGAVFYAYFAPYTYDRHMQLIADMQMHPYVRHVTLGETPDGHDLDLLIVGDESPKKKKVWIIARQHPGETMAEWFMEGLLQRLTDSLPCQHHFVYDGTVRSCESPVLSHYKHLPSRRHGPKGHGCDVKLFHTTHHESATLYCNAECKRYMQRTLHSCMLSLDPLQGDVYACMVAICVTLNVRQYACSHESVARDLLENQATLYCVPNMNPDGSWRGHLRTNVSGINMNRAWSSATEADVPSVYYVQRKMRETGVDLFVDVHGDEALPHNFIACAEGIPSWNERMARCKEEFSQTLRRANPAFQTRVGYDIDAPGTANMGVAANAVAEEFKCFSMTLEQPFKDCADLPDEKYGWSPQRCIRFGGSFVSAVRQIVPVL